eukprot:4074102-Amphidinium_carterae.1
MMIDAYVSPRLSMLFTEVAFELRPYEDDDLAGLCEKMTLQNAFNMEVTVAAVDQVQTHLS